MVNFVNALSSYMFPRVGSVVIASHRNKSIPAAHGDQFEVIGPFSGPEARDVVASIDDKIRLGGQPVEVAHEFVKGLSANVGQREDIKLGGANPTGQL